MTYNKTPHVSPRQGGALTQLAGSPMGLRIENATCKEIKELGAF